MIELSLALVVVAALARDGFRAWLKFRAAREQSFEAMNDMQRQIVELTEHVQAEKVVHDKAIGLLAQDWRARFTQLEADNKKQREYIDTQVAGTIAQLPNTGRGFGR